MAGSRAPEFRKPTVAASTGPTFSRPPCFGRFRFGAAHYLAQHKNTKQLPGKNDSSALGIPGINISQFNSGLVGINIGAFTAPLVGFSASLPWERTEANIDLVDNVTKTHGNHTFLIGFDMRRIRNDLLQTQTYSRPRHLQFWRCPNAMRGQLRPPERHHKRPDDPE